LNVRISVGYQIYHIRRRTGHQSRLRVFKGVKADFLFLQEYFLSKQNVKHPYLISLEFRSSLPIMPMPSMGFSSSRNKKKKKQMMLQQEGSMLCHNNPVDSE
jgi:chaperonin GroEL (HSP60 family)